jgi:regulator of sigma E protease
MINAVRDIGAYLIAISLLVAIHEFGHFWVARRLGVKVLRYSIGFGKPLFSRLGRDGVEYVIAAIPLGGYVKMLDEREGPVAHAELPRAFNRQSVWRRILIFAAGPIFNLLLAVILYWATFVIGVPGFKPLIAEPPTQSAAALAGLHDGEKITAIKQVPVATWDAARSEILRGVFDGGTLPMTIAGRNGTLHTVTLDLHSVRLDPQFLFSDLGLSPYQPLIPPQIGDVDPGSAAAAAHLQRGDTVVAVDDVAIDSFKTLRDTIAARPGQQVMLHIERNNAALSIAVRLGTVDQNGTVIGRLGAGPMANQRQIWQDLEAEQRLSPASAVPEAFRQTLRESTTVLRVLYRMFAGEVSIKNLSGPISTAQMAGFAASIGLSTFLSLLAFISLNVGIANLLPIPVLDGGQIVNLLIEAVLGRPLSERTQAMVQQVGFTLLILIMGFVFINDITRQFG